jgi:hypothetical protein
MFCLIFLFLVNLDLIDFNFYCQKDGTLTIIEIGKEKMPTPMITKFAEKTKKSVDEVEKMYDRAKSIVEKQYKDVEKDSEAYYKLIVGVLKNMLGIKEDSSQASVNLSTMGDYVHAKRFVDLQVRNIDKEKKKTIEEEFMEFMKNRK